MFMPHTRMNFRHKDGPEVSFIEIYKLPITKPVIPPKPRAIEDVAAPREFYRHNYEDLKAGIGIALGAVALIGLVAGASLLAKNSETQSLPSTSVSANPLPEKTTASAEIVANTESRIQAKLIADNLNKDLNGGGSYTTVTLINGTILKNIAKSNNGTAAYEPIIQNAILLSTVDNQKPGLDGNFLNGAYLGVLGSRYNQKTPMTVDVVKFDPSTMRLEAGSEPTITASIFTTQVNVNGTYIAHETLAYNTGSLTQLFNDTTPIYVGEDLTR